MTDKYKDIGHPFDCLIEECAELIHILCKARRFGLDSYHPDDLSKTNNRILILTEIKDVEYRIKQTKELLA